MYYKRINARPHDRTTLSPYLHEWTRWVGVVITVDQRETKDGIKPVALIGSLHNINGAGIELDHINMVIPPSKVEHLLDYRVVRFTAKVYQYKRASKVWLDDLGKWVPYTNYNYGLEDPKKYEYDGMLRHDHHLSMFLKHRLAGLVKTWSFSGLQQIAMAECLLAMRNDGGREWQLQQWWVTCKDGRKKDVNRYIHCYNEHPYGRLWSRRPVVALPVLKVKMPATATWETSLIMNS